jgi:hypothetical protein
MLTEVGFTAEAALAAWEKQLAREAEAKAEEKRQQRILQLAENTELTEAQRTQALEAIGSRHVGAFGLFLRHQDKAHDYLPARFVFRSVLLFLVLPSPLSSALCSSTNSS